MGKLFSGICTPKEKKKIVLAFIWQDSGSFIE